MSRFLLAVLSFYKEHKDWLELIKDIIYILGAPLILYKLYKYLSDRDFIRKTGKIETNLRFRERIDLELQDYVLKQNKNGIKDVGIRLVHWKNYPRQLDDDGYKHLLRIDYENNYILGSSWIDNLGINFQEHPWSFGCSVYIDENGIFFFAQKGTLYKGFTENKDICLVMHMPFTSIVNFDFKEIIEYEPVFYIKYYYRNYKKLYSQHYVIREKLGNPYLRIELDNKKKLDKYSLISYKWLQLKISFFNLLKHKKRRIQHDLF